MPRNGRAPVAPAEPAQGAPEADFSALRRALRLSPQSPSGFTGKPMATQGIVPFGGLLVAQALAAAIETTAPELLPQSMHTYFVGAGRSDQPVDLLVENVHDSRSSSWRTIEVRQEDQLLLRAEAMFSVPRQGLEHQIPMPSTLPPESLSNVGEVLAPYTDVFKFWGADSAFDLRYAPAPPRLLAVDGPGEPHSQSWLRSNGESPADPREIAPLLAFASDMGMLDACLRPAGLWLGEGSTTGLSLDHSLWFHELTPVDDWMLMDLHSPVMREGRGFGIAHIYSQKGHLMCSIAQQSSLRRVVTREP